MQNFLIQNMIVLIENLFLVFIEAENLCSYFYSFELIALESKIIW